jgi:UDP-N-acetylmuramate--alanine ligase
VRGSDVADSANVQRLRERGIEVAIGHRAGQSRSTLRSSWFPQRSSATIPELIEARARGLAVVGARDARRADAA